MEKYILTVKRYESKETALDYAKIVKTLDHYVKKVGLDRFEARLDVVCLEIAEKLGYVFERENDELIFIQRGLQ